LFHRPGELLLKISAATLAAFILLVNNGGGQLSRWCQLSQATKSKEELQFYNDAGFQLKFSDS